jgi:hypothetical protein
MPEYGMRIDEVIEKLKAIRDKNGNLSVVVRGDCLGGIGGIYLDHDHGEDTPFAAIDIFSDPEWFKV